MSHSAPLAVDRPAIEAAAARLAPYLRRTPILRPGTLPGLPADLVLKLELLQASGSFKPRGAFNRMLTATVPKAGVVAASGGNHGAAVAFAAQTLGVAAEIFVPAPTPATKLDRIAGYGARVVQGGASYAEAAAACAARQQETGALNVHAYDDAAVLAGQGTVGMEFAAQAPELTHVLVAVGGGGLIGGVAGWYGGSAQVIAVEPENCPALSRALAAGKPVEAPVSGLAVDSLGARQVGALMFPVAAAHVAQSVLVPDAAIADAQRVLWDACRLIAEPGGATALAALLCGAFVPPPGARIGVVVCGANTDPGKIAP